MAKPKPKPMTKAQRRKLLNVVADFIEPLPKKKFNMNEFGVFPDRDAQKAAAERGVFLQITKGPSLHNCGTAGCALGWAVSIPAVVSAGFGPERLLVGAPDPWLAAAETFGIDVDLSNVVFGIARTGHRTPAEVAKNLRYAAKTGKPAPALRAAYNRERAERLREEARGKAWAE